MQAHHSSTTLSGWRAQVWGLVLFVALLRALLPHEVLAASLGNGNPQLVFCAPSAAVPAGVAAEAMAAHAACLCAPAADSMLASPAFQLSAASYPAAGLERRSDPPAAFPPRPRARSRGPPA